MNGIDAYGTEWANAMEGSFREAVTEARAQSVTADEVEAMMARLGFTMIERTPTADILANAAGRRVSIPTTGPIGMAPLVKALRAAAGLPDEAA